MATSLTAAMEKFTRKMNTTGAANWDAAKGRMAENYRQGLGELGVQVGPTTMQSYQQGIAAVSGSEVARRAAAGAGKWEQNYRQALSR